MYQEITREQLNAAIETINDDVDEITVRGDYSGRGVYGVKCVAVDGQTFGDAVTFMIALAEQLSPLDVDDQKVIICAMAADMKIDYMGLGFVYYFPGWQVVD